MRVLHIIMFLAVIGVVFAVEELFFGEARDRIFYNKGSGPLDCDFDSDCIPAQCCHPTSAVNRENAPDCSDAACTLQCAPKTLDCGQGEIKCINNKCQAIIEE